MSGKSDINIAVLSIYQDLSDSFVEVLSPEQMESMPIGDARVSIDVLAGIPNQDRDFNERMAKADVAVMVVRFLDVLSLEKIRAIYRELLTENGVAVGIALLRDPGEVDFKISCPACGQKLWLRDTDVGKRGRCPNCKKPFVIMSQVDHIKTQLMLSDSVPVVTVVRGDLESFKKGMDVLVKYKTSGITSITPGAHDEVLKNVTARIEIP